ncbi:unnamed protein product [Rotaria sordida]|uniref:SCP domain-containing protein n=1 Tax=Rotaria sordida TaxID=392033 RepID=A0A815QQ04_9BILA|nr:unnamed protein product [Rotaria sordida]
MILFLLYILIKHWFEKIYYINIQDFINIRWLIPKSRHRHQQPQMYYVDTDAEDTLGLTHHYRGLRHRLWHSRFARDMLKLHNYVRAYHSAPPLVKSRRLNKIAQSYAEYLAATSTFQHSGNQLGDESLGENLYMVWISDGQVQTSPEEAVESWYQEIAMHDFDRPTYSPETGHFTQLVWGSTRKLGVGIAYSPNGNEVYIVANYYPAGNIVNPGYFESNVLPPIY